MTNPEYNALTITKEIVTARITNATHQTDKENGEKVGDYFQEIYKKVLEITKNVPN